MDELFGGGFMDVIVGGLDFYAMASYHDVTLAFFDSYL